ncbi:chorismate synthase [Brochothrix campestris]|uniref:Chorismate synthase n=1 Tax=Brochothrix campestris FSL F6-1037 TaxID=1265861 RepID=W7D865_9LIST|nr:chorismate synthase [Brochothrix campestris]EUJ41608.1 chorismate synthase [Brochothrix campestris FSL F6-1037]
MRYLTAGESHGPQLTTIIEGLPAGFTILAEDINKDLKRRQGGYGRGGRMKIEKDQVAITAGVRHGKTLGSPVALAVTNLDYRHWLKEMGSEPIADDVVVKRTVTRPRPGHADLVGGIKYGHRDLRNVLERSSARETTMRVAAGSVAKQLLSELGITVASHVRKIGGVTATVDISQLTASEIQARAEQSETRTLDEEANEQMKARMDQARRDGDTIGGLVEVVVDNVPEGIGSYVHYDRKLDARIAAAVMSINAFKGVEFGLGFEMANIPGSEVQDEILYNETDGYSRRTNHLGGFEGGMSTGMPIVVRGVMKPIPTLYRPLQSVDIDTKEPFKASVERSDSCAVPAASVVAEHVVAWEVANAILEEFSHATLADLKREVAARRQSAKEF